MKPQNPFVFLPWILSRRPAWWTKGQYQDSLEKLEHDILGNGIYINRQDYTALHNER